MMKLFEWLLYLLLESWFSSRALNQKAIDQWGNAFYSRLDKSSDRQTVHGDSNIYRSYTYVGASFKRNILLPSFVCCLPGLQLSTSSNSGVERSIMGGHIHILVFWIINFFRNLLSSSYVNTNLLIWAPSIIDLPTPLSSKYCSNWQPDPPLLSRAYRRETKRIAKIDCKSPNGKPVFVVYA